MKKIYLLFFCFFVMGSTYAQKTIDSYIASYFEKEKYDIKASSNKNGRLSVYFSVNGEEFSDDVSFNFDGNDIILFIAALDQAKDKYIEWSDVAKKNNVKDMSKEINVDFPKVTIAWHDSEWRFAFNHKLSPYFRVTEDGICLFVMSGKVTASDNEYIDKKYFFVLSNSDEFVDLATKISPLRIIEKLNQDTNVEDLFK